MMLIKSAVEQFIDDYLVLEKRLSNASISAYKTDLNQYENFLGQNKLTELAKIQLGDIEKFVGELRDRKLAQSSIARKISAVRSFHLFCLNEGFAERDPSELLKIRQPHRKLPKVIPSEYIDRLMEMPLNSEPAGIRDRAILELMYGCGLRISELTNLSLTQLHLSDEILRVEGKGNKTRFVPIGRKAREALQRYLDLTRPGLIRKKSADEGKVFLNRLGKPISRIGVYNIIRNYLERAFPGKNYTPHTLRHSFATHIIEGGGDIRTVQELLGHVSISTTQIYTHLDRKFLQSIMTKYHPRG